MNKSELIEAIAKESGLSKKDARVAVNAFTNVVSKELCKKGKVKLVGFGTYEVSEKPDKTGRNPQTGNTIAIPATFVPKFKAGKALKASVNGKK